MNETKDAPTNPPQFERIYVPQCHKDEEKIKELIETASENGFRCSGNIEELTQKTNYFIVLLKLKTDKFTELSIDRKEANKVLLHLENNKELYSPERAREWVIEKAKEK
jgi:hypothetical protein